MASSDDGRVQAGCSSAEAKGYPTATAYPKKETHVLIMNTLGLSNIWGHIKRRLTWCHPAWLYFGTFMVCTVFTLRAGAQVDYPDELRQGRQVTPAKPRDIDMLIKEGKELYRGNRGDSALKTLLLAVEQSSAIPYQRGIDTAVKYLVYYLDQREGDLTTWQADLVQKAIRYGNVGQRNLGIAWLYNISGNDLVKQGRYAQALLELENALQVLPENTSKAALNLKMIILEGKSQIWANLGEAEEALDILEEAERIAIRSKDYHRQNRHLQTRGILFYNMKQLDSALYYLNAALDRSNQENNAHLRNCNCKKSTVANLAVVLLQQHKPAPALKLVDQQINELRQEEQQQVLKGFLRERMSDMMAFLLYLKGYAYYELKDYARARSILLPLLDTVREQGVNQVESNIHEILSATYDAIGEFRKAYLHKTAYTDLVTDHEVQKEKSKLLALRYSIEKASALAEKQLLISEQEAKIREKNFWIGATSLGTLLLATTLFAFYRNNKSKQKLQTSSITNLKQEKEIAQLQAKVEGEEQERSRIAHELHDGIVSQLLSLKLKVNALQMRNKTIVRPYELNDIAIQLDEATQDLRRTAHNLMPNLLLQQGLALSVAALCEKVDRNTGIEADFQAYGQLPRLPQDTELALFRMIQELVQNVLKHAEATQLLVQLSCRENLLSITVEDNGKGIPISYLISIEKSTGLAHIRKRAELMGGQLDIKSNPGKKTTVYLEFELSNLLTEYAGPPPSENGLMRAGSYR